jgi:tetratricopeptide (TPR) repeat protein
VLSRASARLASSPENVPPGTTASSLLVLCHMMKSVVCASIGEYDDSVQCSQQASDLAASSGRPYDLIAANYGRGIVRMIHGDLEAAESALDEASRLSRLNEVHLFLPLVLSALGNIYLQRGRAEKARDVLLEARAEAQSLGHETGILLASAYLASAYGQLGHISEGLEVARACQAGAKQKGYQPIEALALFAEAFNLSLQGASGTAEAIDKLEQTIEVATTLGTRPLLGLAKGTLARLLAASGRKADAQTELVEAIELFAKSKMTIQLERAKATLSKFSGL